MPGDQDSTQTEHSFLERLRHSMVLLIFLDLITLGLYSAARTYLVHTELSQKTGRRIFSPAFLHILIILNLLLFVLRFSRESTPWDTTVIMARFGTGLLLITLLLTFRRYLRHEFKLRIRPLPLAVFGFWYLQYKINRRHQHPFNGTQAESRLVPIAVILLSLSLFLALGALKHYRVSNSAMEPSLVVGDHVLVDQLSFLVERSPRRTDIVAYRPIKVENSIQVKRVLGLPGDRLGFHGDLIFLNDKPLPCYPAGRKKPGDDALDQKMKRLFVCEMEGRTFTIQRYNEGALTAIQGDFEVPPQHYFLIGDNLDNSPDSRTIGPIPAENILGRARMTTISYRLGEPILWQRWFQLL
jgi:signal peptidase I